MESIKQNTKKAERMTKTEAAGFLSPAEVARRVDEALRRAHASIDDEAETVHEALVILEQMREEVRHG